MALPYHLAAGAAVRPCARIESATVATTVTLSILAHGLSAAPAARRYGELATRMEECEETKTVSEMPTRVRMKTRANLAGTDAA